MAERASDVNLLAEARLSLAGALMLAGDTEEAMTTLAATRATGETAVLVASQRAMALGMLGRYEEARQAYGPVITGFRRLGDRVREARAVGNRGLLYAYTGRFSQADADFAQSGRRHVAARPRDGGGRHLPEPRLCCRPQRRPS